MTKLALRNGLLLAIETIRSHKLRAFLTVLGVIIGTGTIIGVSAIGCSPPAAPFVPGQMLLMRFAIVFVTLLVSRSLAAKSFTCSMCNSCSRWRICRSDFTCSRRSSLSVLSDEICSSRSLS